MENLSIKDIYESISGILVLIGIFGGFIAWISSLYAKVTKIYKVCDIISKEFQPNGGSSFRDCINRIESNQRNLQLTKLALYSYINENCKTPMFISSQSGECIWVNSAYRELLQHSEDEYIGLKWESFIHQDDRDKVIEEWYNCCIDGKSFDMSYRLIKSNGEIISIKCKSYGDKNTGYVGFITKI